MSVNVYENGELKQIAGNGYSSGSDSDRSEVIPIENGGTGAKTVEEARKNLGIQSVPINGDTVTETLVMPKSHYAHKVYTKEKKRGYAKIARLTIERDYTDRPLTFIISRRDTYQPTILSILFETALVSSDPNVKGFTHYSGLTTKSSMDPFEAAVIKIEPCKWDIYIRKTADYDNVIIHDFYYSTYSSDSPNNQPSVEWLNEYAETLPEEAIYSKPADLIANLIGNVNGVKLGVDADGNPGYYKAGADTVTPFKTGGDASDLYSVLQYSGLVTPEMSFEEMCEVLLKHFPKTYYLYANSKIDNEISGGWNTQSYMPGATGGNINITYSPNVSIILTNAVGGTSVSVYIVSKNRINLTGYKTLHAVGKGALSNASIAVVKEITSYLHPNFMLERSQTMISKDFDISGFEGEYYVALMMDRAEGGVAASLQYAAEFQEVTFY